MTRLLTIIAIPVAFIVSVWPTPPALQPAPLQQAEPVVVVPTAAPRPGARFHEVNPDGTISHGYYRITALLQRKRYVTWEYVTSPDGSIHFKDRTTGRLMVISGQYLIEVEYAAAGWTPPKE